MRDYAKLRRDYANSWAACAALTCLFEQIGGHGQVTPALVLPLACDVVELRTFASRTFGGFLRNFGWCAEMAAEGDRIKRLHLCRGDCVQLLDFPAVWQRHRIAFTG